MPTQPPSPNMFWLWPKRRCPFSELRGAMCDKLYVFLQKETKNFVDDLFVTLETNSYLQSNPEPPGVATQSEAHNVPIAATAAIIPVAEEVNNKSSTNTIVKTERDSRTNSTKRKHVDRTRRRSWRPRYFFIFQLLSLDFYIFLFRSRSRFGSRERTGIQLRSRSRDRSSMNHRRGRGGGWDADHRSRRSAVVSSHRTDQNRPQSLLPSGRISHSQRNPSYLRPRSPSGPTNNKQSSDVVPPSDNAATSTPEVVIRLLRYILFKLKSKICL